MNDQGAPMEAPPDNRAKTLFRVTLWFLPAGFAVSCILGISRFSSYLISSGIHYGVIGYLLTAAFTFGTGWYNALLSNRARLEPRGLIGRTILFFVIQHFLVPLFLLILFAQFANTE